MEFSLIQKDVLYGLQQGNKVLKELNKELSLERVENLMGETADAIAYQQVCNLSLLTAFMCDHDEY